ncbi:MAG: hypothetical protein QN174_13150 [Armatimonadota bacterium]|nr:hypothetical protein [Armatimonadota bacterium]MDR7453119.1 hypothetical protein [Armatimonadota bacterium]MDR7456140.1 hypothetical protein [Armatimonadota bacterium]MDR7497893.1 hypothetical protein [Armatimonadota bacterium]
MATILTGLHYLNLALAAAVLWKGFFGCPASPDRFAVLLIAWAVAIVGPIEEVLVWLVRRRHPASPEPRIALADKVTSALFLTLVLLAFFRLCEP